MPIDLSLGRVAKLLQQLGNPHINSFKSIHVAGTNGKGSTLAYLSAILTQARITNGRFTSPHLITYNDCVTINNHVYPSQKFETIKGKVTEYDANLKLGCTEFEILTATAFKIFELENVELALIEVGVGGRLDATNVLEPYEENRSSGGLLVSGITKIAMDHQGLLGDNLTSIAGEKAGIIKRGIPVVVDSTNTPEVISVLAEKARLEGAPLHLSDTSKASSLLHLSPLLGSYQLQNLSVAIDILGVLHNVWAERRITHEVIVAGITKTCWPGRLQKLTDTVTQISFILDGAHNESAALELNKFLQETREEGIIFVIGLTRGKPIESFVLKIMKEGDVLIPISFTQPENMPWIESYQAKEISQRAKKYVDNIIENDVDNIHQIFKQLRDMRRAGDLRPIVICGSLYLCSDVLRHLSTRESSSNVE